MRFLSIYQGVERDTPPTEDEMTTMGAFIEESARAGWLLSAEGCLPSAMGARVRLAGGKVTVLDGPFTEAKEIVGGFAIIQANSKEEAITWTRRFLEVAGDGECEIRQLYEDPALAPQANPSESRVPATP
jgi:hypothetical protein